MKNTKITNSKTHERVDDNNGDKYLSLQNEKKNKKKHILKMNIIFMGKHTTDLYLGPWCNHFVSLQLKQCKHTEGYKQSYFFGI